MRQNSKNRFNARYSNRGFRPQVILRNTALDSNGPCGKLHGTALQLFEKYQASAKDALIQNDAVLAETCLQFADHYMRIQNIAIANEEAARANTFHKQPEAKITSDLQTDELPIFEAEQNIPVPEKKNDTPLVAAAAESEADTLSEATLKTMDLSVPVSAIQEKHDIPKGAGRGRKTLRPKKENLSA